MRIQLKTMDDGTWVAQSKDIKYSNVSGTVMMVVIMNCRRLHVPGAWGRGHQEE